MKLLIESGADQSHKDKTGKKAIDYAIEAEKLCRDKKEVVIIKNILALLKV